MATNRYLTTPAPRQKKARVMGGDVVFDPRSGTSSYQSSVPGANAGSIADRAKRASQQAQAAASAQGQTNPQTQYVPGANGAAGAQRRAGGGSPVSNVPGGMNTMGAPSVSGAAGGQYPGQNPNPTSVLAPSNAGGGIWLGDTGAGDVAHDPTLMLRAMMNGQINSPFGNISPTGFAALSPLGDVMNAFYLLSNPGYQNGNNPNFLNFAQDFWNKAGQGDFFNSGQLWNNLNHPTGFLADYLGGNGTELDPQTQAQNYKQLATAIAGATMNPLMAQAYMNHLNSQLGNFGLMGATTAAPGMPNIADYIMGRGQ